MKIGFGAICYNFDSTEPYIDFLKNAQKHGWKIDCLIVAYENILKKKVVEQLSKYTEVIYFKSDTSSDVCQRLQNFGADKDDVNNILMTNIFKKTGHLPYGAHRNYVLLEGLLQSLDYLFFFDTDVYPKLLTSKKGNKGNFKEVDWLKHHLDYLTKPKVTATTSDYTGYFIIPPIKESKSLKPLFTVIQKNYNYYRKLVEKDCLVTQKNETIFKPFQTEKLLGGNLGLSLKNMQVIPPFYSTYYFLNNKVVLSRGEDTIMGPSIYYSKDRKAVDIGVRIFHNTFKDFPNRPDIYHNPDRFYNAVLGWIGRNPFYNWYMHKIKKQKLTPFQYYKEQKKIIDIAAKQSADFFEDQRFMNLPEALENSFGLLDHYVEHFRNILKSWKKTVKIMLNKNY